MESNPTSKRRYNSTRRRQQADQTLHSILEAATRLFEQRGYASTTMDAIAQEAGVAVETVYSAYGSKSGLLRRIIDTTLVGDYDPTPFFERPFIQEALAQPEPQLLIQHFASDIFSIMTRMSPIFDLLRSTAKSDKDIKALRFKILQRRREGMDFFIKALLKFGPLRKTVPYEQAVDSVFALSSAEMFELLTHDLEWSKDQYVTWLSAAISRLLLPRRNTEK